MVAATKPMKAGTKRWRWLVFIILKKTREMASLKRPILVKTNRVWCQQVWASLVGDDSLGELAHVDEEKREGEDPSQVVTGKVEPGVVMDLDLGRLAAPA